MNKFTTRGERLRQIKKPDVTVTPTDTKGYGRGIHELRQKNVSSLVYKKGTLYPIYTIYILLLLLLVYRCNSCVTPLNPSLLLGCGGYVKK